MGQVGQVVAPSQSPPQGEKAGCAKESDESLDSHESHESDESDESYVGWQYVKELLLGQK